MQAILAVIEALLAQLSAGSATVTLATKIVSALVALVPIVQQEYKDLVPILSNIIAMGKNVVAGTSADPATITAMLDQLDAAEATLDAAYDEAAALAAAEDAAAAAKT